MRVGVCRINFHIIFVCPIIRESRGNHIIFKNKYLIMQKFGNFLVAEQIPICKKKIKKILGRYYIWVSMFSRMQNLPTSHGQTSSYFNKKNSPGGRNYSRSTPPLSHVNSEILNVISFHFIYFHILQIWRAQNNTI